MASLLTTIYAEMVKTAAIRKFSHASMLASPSPGSPYSPLLLSRSCSPGVLRKRPISERAWGRFVRMRFANGGDIDHLDADCGQNRRHSQSRTPTPMLAKLIPARGVGKLHALALAKPASLWQQDDTFASASPPLRSGKDYAFMQAKGRSLAPARRPEVKNSVFGLPFIP